jgi:hypothetical protein
MNLKWQGEIIMSSTLEKSVLFRSLKEQDDNLAERLCNGWKEAEPLLRHAASTHPSHTSHGPDHALALVDILDKALESILSKIKLSADEIYILLCASLIHDIGMVGAVSGSVEDHDRLRREHHVLTHHYILDHIDQLHIPHGHAESIADVAAAHRKWDIEIDIVERPININSSAIPRTKLCAALLRFADECHITNDRVPANYETLQLSDKDADHFQCHRNITARTFEPNIGQIIFNVTIDDERSDKLYRAARDKLESAMDNLEPIFTKNMIPYSKSKLIWKESRDNFIRYKVIRALLQNEICSIEILLKMTDEQKEDLERFLHKFGSSSPFNNISGTEYSLKENQDTFNFLGDIFLSKTQKPDDPLIFIQSIFTQKILKDNYLDALTDKFITNSSNKKIIHRILRESPSALKYVLDNVNTLPQANIAGGGGFLRSLIAEIENDFQQHPELLLRPALLDEIFEDGKRELDEWNHWRIWQIAEYHKAFDKDIIYQQWLLSDSKDEEKEPPFRLQFTIESPKESFCDPGPLMAASRRLGLPLALRKVPGASFTIKKITQDGIEGERDIVSFETKPSLVVPEAKYILPGKLVCTNNRNYNLELLQPPQGDENKWLEPLRISLKLKSPIGNLKAGPQNVQFTCSIKINYDLLDCHDALVCLEVAKGQIESLTVIGSFNSTKPLILSDENNPLIIMPEYDEEEESFLKTMAKIQELIHIRIPFPFAGWPKRVQEIALKTPVTCESEANAVWQEIAAKIDQEGKPTVSPGILEIKNDNIMLDRILLGHELGVHNPRLQFHFKDSKMEDPQSAIEHALDNPNEMCSVSDFCLNLSPQNALSFLLRQQSQNKSGNPGVLSKFKATSPAECMTRLEYRWEPSIDYVWYNITPFRCVLSLVKPFERWLYESRYLSDENNDSDRAYIGTKEAYRLIQNEHTCINFGWSAYLVDRIDEAISVTNESLSNKNGEEEFPALINLGLFCLRGAVVTKEKEEEYLSKANNFYMHAIETLRQLEKSQALLRIEESINDIQRFRDRLHGKAEEYIEKLRSLRSEILSK